MAMCKKRLRGFEPSECVSSARLALPPAALGQVGVRLIEGVPALAVSGASKLRREANTSQEVDSLRDSLQMIWPYTSSVYASRTTDACGISVVAEMVDLKPVRDGTDQFCVTQNVGVAVPPESSVAVLTQCSRPQPAGFGLPDVVPEVGSLPAAADDAACPGARLSSSQADLRRVRFEWGAANGASER